MAHPSADPAALATAMVRGAFEYQGQKCSAASRVYIPDTMWRAMRKDVLDTIAGIPMGDVADFRTFMGAIIDQAAFDDIKGYVDHAKASPDAEILVGGECDPSEGYFIRPTLIQAKKPDYKSI